MPGRDAVGPAPLATVVSLPTARAARPRAAGARPNPPFVPLPTRTPRHSFPAPHGTGESDGGAAEDRGGGPVTRAHRGHGGRRGARDAGAGPALRRAGVLALLAGRAPQHQLVRRLGARGAAAHGGRRHARHPRGHGRRAAHALFALQGGRAVPHARNALSRPHRPGGGARAGRRRGHGAGAALRPRRAADRVVPAAGGGPDRLAGQHLRPRHAPVGPRARHAARRVAPRRVAAGQRRRRRPDRGRAGHRLRVRAVHQRRGRGAVRPRLTASASARRRSSPSHAPRWR